MIAVPDPAVVTAPPPAAQKPINLAEIRHHIYVMEGALARAVDYGAKQLNREILAVMPGVFMLEGEARARGVHLESYGVFFDVRVPMMRQSMMWSMRMMFDRADAANQTAAYDLRRYMGHYDPKTRASLRTPHASCQARFAAQRNASRRAWSCPRRGPRRTRWRRLTSPARRVQSHRHLPTACGRRTQIVRIRKRSPARSSTR
jgi:hypothetical protein